VGLIRLCIQRPVGVAVAALLLVLAGLLAVVTVPVQLTPNVDTTVITVSTFWEGASPAEIEREILIEQENFLKGVSNLRKITSVAQQSSGTVRLEFIVGADKDDAFRQVSDKLREVPSYPDGVDNPVVTAGDQQSRDYIAWILLTCADPDFDTREAYDFAYDHIKPYLERVDGLSEVRVLGGREREVQIRIDADALAARQVSMSEFVSALRRENVNVSAGQLPEGKRDVRFRVVGEYEELEQIRLTVVAHRDGVPVRVRDLGEVVQTFKEPTSVVRSKGRTVLALNVQREPGANVLSVMDGLKRALGELNGSGGLLESETRRLALAKPFVLEQVYDQTIYIYNALELVRSNIYIGGALAAICLLLFLRSFRATLIIALTIPVSIVGAFLALQLLGRNVNVISLAGMAFAVGMVVDNAVVVLENTYRRRQMGDSAPRAALRGAGEVWAAILISTLTTVIVFIPVLTVQEEVGQLFRDISLAICAAVLLSLIASITIIPPAAARLLKADLRSASPKANRNPVARFGGAVQSLYAAFLDVALGSWVLRLAVVSGLALAAVVGAVVLTPPSSYLPAGNRNLIFAFLIPPPGYNLEKQIALGQRIESTLRPYWQAAEQRPFAPTTPIASVNPYTGAPSTVTPPPIDNFFFVAFPGAMFMGATSAEENNVKPLVDLFSHAARPDVVPGVFAIPFQTPLFNIGGFGSGNSVELEITGDSLDDVRRAAGAIMGKAFEFVGQRVFSSVRPDPGNFNIPAQEVRAIINRAAAADVGLSVTDVGLAARAVGDGAVIGEYNYAGDRIDLRVIEARQADWSNPRLSFSDLASIPLATPSGKTVPLGVVASLQRVDSPQQINRVEGRRSVSLVISAPPGVALERATAVVENDIIAPLRAAGAIPPSVRTSLAGAADKLTQVRAQMLGDWSGSFWSVVKSLLSSRIFIALLCCYLVMCALFENWLYPLVILISVPLALVGGLAALRLVHTFDPLQQLDTLTMLGFVILIGTVVNNAILIVAQALNFMRGFGETEHERIERMPYRAAIAESARTRLRPIMMTSLTSTLGMLPLVLQPGAGSELYRGLGAVVVGGLACSTVFTLFLVPMLMSLVIDARIAITRALGREWDPAAYVRLSEQPAPAHTQAAQPHAMLARLNGDRS